MCKARAFLKKPIRYFINLERASNGHHQELIISEEIGYLGEIKESASLAEIFL